MADEEFFQEEFDTERPLDEAEEWNIYREETREQMVDDDEMDPEEEGFMRGYEEEY